MAMLIKEHESLESKCIKTILDYCIDMTTYDLIDAVYHNRVGSIVISYQLIKQLCQLLKIKHLFDKFLDIYGVKLTTYLQDLVKHYPGIYDICGYCGYSVIIDDYDDKFLIGLCKNNHKTVWTDGHVDCRLFEMMRDSIDDYCLICGNEYQVTLLPHNYKALINDNGQLLIIQKNYKDFGHSLRRNKFNPIDIPRGKTIYAINNNKYDTETICIKWCSRFSELINSEKYIEKIYSMYQDVMLTENETKRIKSIIES